MNKSEQLAKLLGIEPKYKLRYRILEDDFYILDKQQCENHISNTKNIYYQPHIEDKEVYPNFTDPVNFVLLYQLKIDTAVKIWNEYKEFELPKYRPRKHNSIQEMLIEHIVWSLKQEVPAIYGDKYENWKKLFKQQAQQANWKY